MDSGTIVGVIIGGLALIVAIIQLWKSVANKKSRNASANQKIGNNSTANQQTHTGKGDNISAGRDVNF